MTNLKTLITSLLLCCIFAACSDDLAVVESLEQASKGVPHLMQSRSADGDKSPVYTGERILLEESALESSMENFKAKNISFISQKELYAAYKLDNDTVVVKAFQNLVKITDLSYNPVSEILVTLVPTPEYYSTHKSMDWESFRFYEKNSDFSGYEIYSEPDNGNVFAIRYYQNGQYQYGPTLRDSDINLNMKRAFLLKLGQKFSLITIEATKSRESHVITKTEKETVYDNETQEEKEIDITYIYVVEDGPSQGDADNPRQDYLPGGGNGKQHDNGDNLQKDDIKIEGNTFFKEPIISSYLIDSSFPDGGYDSSPCLAVALALLYFDIAMTPDQIFSEVDSDNGTLNIFNDYITATDLETLLSRYLRYNKGSVESAIASGKCCIVVSKTGYSGSVYKCMLIVGYTSTHDYIYLDPVTGLLKCRPNDFLNGYTYVITGKK